MEPPRVVTNASPLIYLSILNHISLLDELFSEVYLPEAVYREVVIQGRGQPGAKETQTAVDEGWLRRTSVKNRAAVEGLLDDLHLGEAEAIVLARELDIGRVILDDRAARSKANLMGLLVTGTIGVLLLAREKGLAKNIQEDLNRLRPLPTFESLPICMPGWCVAYKSRNAPSSPSACCATGSASTGGRTGARTRTGASGGTIGIFRGRRRWRRGRRRNEARVHLEMEFQAHSGSRLQADWRARRLSVGQSALADLGYQPEILFQGGEPDSRFDPW